MFVCRCMGWFSFLKGNCDNVFTKIISLPGLKWIVSHTSAFEKAFFEGEELYVKAEGFVIIMNGEMSAIYESMKIFKSVVYG